MIVATVLVFNVVHRTRFLPSLKSGARITKHLVNYKNREAKRENNRRYGFTNMGHPLACAASLAVLDILEKDKLVENSAEVGAYLHSNAERFLARRTIADARGKGLLMVLELVRDKDTMEWFAPEANADEKFQALGLKNGLAFYMSLYGPRRPGALKRGMPIFIAPPLCITREQVDELMDRLDQTLGEWESAMGI